MGIYVYPHDCKDFSTTGLCGDLQPIEAYFEEEKNGISQIEMTLHYDKNGKWKEAKVGRYIKAYVPVRVVPKIEDDAYSGTIQKIKIKSGTRQTYVNKSRDMLYLLLKDGNGNYYDREMPHVPTESWLSNIWTENGIAEIRTQSVKVYMNVDDFDYIETVEIPAALDGVETVTGETRVKPQFFIITSVEQSLDGMIVTAKHVFYELLHNATTYKTENTVQAAAACRQVFDNLISADDRFDIYCDCTEEQKGLDYDRFTPVQALLDPDEGICAKYGLSLIRDNYSIYALKNVGTDRGFVVEYGKNMLSVDCVENIDETYTRIIPFGKDSKGNVIYMDGQKWIDSERIKDYTVPRVLLLDCTDTASVGKGMTLEQAKAELKKRAQEELENGIDKPNIEMTVDFLSLGDTEEFKQYRDLDKVYMFDRITVKDKVRGYDYAAEVVSVRHNLLTGMLESCTIGSLEKASAARKIASWQVPTVDGGNIRLQSIVPGILGSGAVGTDNIQDGAIVAGKIEARAITSDKIDAGAITAEKIEADSITADKMKTGTITAESGIIADGCVGTAQIADGSITEAKIVSLNADVIQSGTLQTDRLLLTGEGGVVYEINAASSGLTQSELSEEEYKNKIDGSVLVAKSVTAAQIAAEAITANEILSGAITTDKLDANAVTTDKLAAHSVTANKLASDVGSSLDLSSNNSINLIVDSMNSRIDAIQGQSDFVQFTEPTGNIEVGDTWTQIATPQKTWGEVQDTTLQTLKAKQWGELYYNNICYYVWNGMAWVQLIDDAAQKRTISEIEQTTNSVAIRVEEVAGKTPEILRNTSVEVDLDGIRMNTGGTFEVESGNFDIDTDGKMTAKAGSIGGWEIGPGSLYAGEESSHVRLSTEDATYGIWAGAEEAENAPFRVAKDGTVYLTKLYVTDADGNAQANPVNLRTSYWKMDKAYSRAVQSMAVANNTLTITLYDGTSINFKKASDFDNFHVTAAGSGSNNVTITVSAITETADVLGTQAITATLNTSDKRVTIASTGTAANGYVDCTGIYNNGWNECINNCTGENVLSNWQLAGQALYDKDGNPVAGPWYKGTLVYRYAIPGKL